MPSRTTSVDQYEVPDDNDGMLPVSTGGVSTTAIAAGTVANTTVKATPGRLCKVLLTSANGASPVTITDGGGGTVIGYIPASAVAGSQYDFSMPAAVGIVVVGVATNAAMTVSWA